MYIYRDLGIIFEARAQSRCYKRLIKGWLEICTIACRNFMGYKILAQVLSVMGYLTKISSRLGKEIAYWHLFCGMAISGVCIWTLSSLCYRSNSVLSTNIPGMWAAQNQHKPCSIIYYPEKTYRESGPDRGVQIIAKERSQGGGRQWQLMCRCWNFKLMCERGAK